MLCDAALEAIRQPYGEEFKAIRAYSTFVPELVELDPSDFLVDNRWVSSPKSQVIVVAGPSAIAQYIERCIARRLADSQGWEHPYVDGRSRFHADFAILR